MLFKSNFMLAHLLQVSHSNHLNSGLNRDLSKKCTYARGSACVLMVSYEEKFADLQQVCTRIHTLKHVISALNTFNL